MQINKKVTHMLIYMQKYGLNRFMGFRIQDFSVSQEHISYRKVNCFLH